MDSSSGVHSQCLVAHVYGVVPAWFIASHSAMMISAVTVWRILFSKLIGKPCGAYSARVQCGTPIKPSIVCKHEANQQSKWKLDSLRYFYLQNPALMKTLAADDQVSKTKSRHRGGFDDKLDFLKNSVNCSKSEILQYFRYIEHTEKYNEHCSKFSEEFWKFITMTLVTVYGCMLIFHADYFYDTKLYFASYPQAYTEAMETYYKISVGYHGHRALWQVFDTKRKDFWAMCIHHWVTILLIVGSWHIGVMQTGCVVMFCHDNSDVLLAASKLCVYNKWKWPAKILFASFVLSWIVSRICVYSWKVIYSLIFQGAGLYDCHWAYPPFVAGLCILLLLHFYWLRMILAMACKSLCGRSEVADTRSDSDDEADQEDAEDEKEAQLDAKSD
eukprot:CAMPEP_0197027570 /NCGR_PEP_ID=MMETSP1384-20130603/7446_1 /TAXON_ID=29189 /ORGANISM="Ammonia sp." /LENGTH=386 /DNA_ID=CAMNT_0042456431 /DNA_START=60 /DNA_END=1220 /DNA_ORIENTATION=+